MKGLVGKGRVSQRCLYRRRGEKTIGGMCMNQNNNNNGYEVMNSGGMYHQPRYPYAKAPGSEFQQMNYKDWMNRCTNGQTGELFSSGRNAVIIATGIGWAILGFVPVIGPGLSAAAGVLNVIIPYLWPEEAGPPGTPAAQFTWEQLMTAVEEMINQRVDVLIKGRAIETTRILQSRLRDYQQAICNLRMDPNDERYKADVRREFNDVEDQAKSAVIQFNPQTGNETEDTKNNILLLADYAQAANVHLLLLRDVVQYGESWGFSPLEVQQYYSNISSVGNPGMLQLLAIYTDHCMQWYNAGLNQLRQGTGRNGRWNKYNDFRRNMTTMALDIVSLWPTYDPKKYPLFTKSQLTRQVYTRLTNPVTVFDYDDPTYTSPPSLFRWLHEITLYRRAVNDEETNLSKLWGQFQGYKMTFGTTLGGNLDNIETPLIGRTGPLVNVVNINQGSGDVYEIKNIHRERLTAEGTDGSLQKLEFYFTSGKVEDVGIDYAGMNGYDTVTIEQGLACNNSMNEVCVPCSSSCTPGQNNSLPCDNPNLYSERLSWMRANYSGTNFPQMGLSDYLFGWTHVSADANNLIDPVKITQIPAVKGYKLESGASVIKGPGSTGGDLVKLPSGEGAYIKVTRPVKAISYKIRIRYASNAPASLNIDYLSNNAYSRTYDIPATYTGANLTYSAFAYLDTLVIPSREGQMVDEIYMFNGFFNNADLLIDKIEFIPIEGSLEEYQAQEALEKAQKAVNALFTNDAKHTLKLNVTDYQVNQAARLVECMLDEIYPKDKMCLLDHVKCAKRLSQARNLLNYGDFETSDWSGADGWKTSNHVSVESGNPIFKGRYLKLPGANQPQFSNQVFPTYAYQKIEESRLKPYTRYRVRGFIGNSKDLEVFVARYEKEVHKKLHVPNDILPANPCTGEYPLEQGAYPVVTNQEIPQNMACGPCDDGSQMMMQQTSMVCVDPHEWECHIDTGELDMNQNLGIWVGFKIGTTDGMALLDNLEVVEEGPLTGEALARMKKREHKWKQKGQEKQMKIEKAVQVARGALQTLFTNADQNQLQASITLNEILHAEKWVQKIPYVYHPFLGGALPTVPGEAYDIFQQLSNAVATARALYEQRNVLRNGDFNAGLANWNGTEGANIQQIDNASVLVISDWSTNVSQEVCVHPEQGYVLRVTAKKEGSGEGYVKISDGTEENTETLKFTAEEGTTSATSPMMPPRESYYEQNMANYPSQNTGNRACVNENPMSYQSESFGINPYSDEYGQMNHPSAPYMGTDCGCGCRTNAYAGDYPTMSDASNGYERNAYPGSIHQTIPMKSSCGCGCHTKESVSETNMTTYPSESLSGYITKTVEIFPETNRVCIEIGETSGTFMVESVELIRMGCE
uniref:Crystaline entomocidal protoxin n=1 Tax=Bacillus thuringiensis TaxID=1428 RepID=A0A2P0NZ66_BACTU|nr:Cry32N protein [Bacillus thuringiensis]